MRSRETLAKVLLALAAMSGLAARARAADVPALDPSSVAPIGSSLPTFARTPAPSPSPWAGLYIGSGLSVSGGKGIKGGIGGDAYLGYNRELSNNLVVGMQAVSGYSPNLSSFSRARGFDYAGANVKVGYDMGRLMPYVTAGVGFAKANFGPAGRYNSSDSLNDLFNRGGGPLQTITQVGAGFDYAISDKLTVGFSVSATQSQGTAVAPVLP